MNEKQNGTCGGGKTHPPLPRSHAPTESLGAIENPRNALTTVTPLKVGLHPTEVLSQFIVMTPEAWGTSPAEVALAHKMEATTREMGIPLYLLGWPDGVRVAVTTVLPPEIAAWAKGIVKAYMARANGQCGLVRSSRL